MTICIAAICEGGHTILVAADRELGVSYTSAEFEGKWHHLYDNWSIGIAGTVHHATDVIARARHLRGEMDSTMALDVQSCLAKAYRKARMEKAEARFLANRGWTLNDFVKVGGKQMPPDTYATVDAQISLYNFDADLLVAGFGPGDLGPAILSAVNPGVTNDHSKLGFWCIGSGSTAAQMSLFSREYSWRFSVEKAAYYVYEAKVAAEKATGVGRATDLHMIIHGTPGQIVIQVDEPTLDIMEKIRKTLAPKEFRSRDHALLRAQNSFSDRRLRA